MKTLDIDADLCLAPQEMENLFDHPVVSAAAALSLEDASYREEAVEVFEKALEITVGHRAPALIFGLLEALSTIIANVNHAITLEKEKEVKRSRFSVISGGK